MLAIGIVAHVSNGEDQVGLIFVTDLLAQLGRFGGGIAEFQGLDVVGVDQLGGVFRGQADHRDLEAVIQPEYLVGVEVMLAAGLVIDVGRQHGEPGPLTLLLQHIEGVVELVVAHRHGVVANAVHRDEIGLGILQIRLGHPCVDVTPGEHQHFAAGGPGFGAQPLDQGLLGRHAIFVLGVVPETAMGVVGVQHSQLADIFSAGGNGVIARGITASQGSQHGQRHGASDEVLIHIHITLIMLLFMTRSGGSGANITNNR